MRTVNIDLSTDNAGSGEKIYVGYTGEHNATELVAEIPQTMARESDYLIAVFLTGDKIVRSRKITAERDFGAPYLDGDEVHIYLSQKLTGNTTLGIQIEGYAKDENGISTLVGKSAYISNLTFRLSPKGESDSDVTPDYDEIAELIKKAAESSGKGIDKYDNCTLLPADAEDGDIAYVLNDYGETITEPFEFEKRYARFVPKQSISLDCLKELPVTDTDSGYILRAAGVKFKTASADRERICYSTFLHYEPVGSIMAFADFASRNDLYQYGTDDILYIYLSGDGDFAPLIESDEPVQLSSGWYVMKESRSNYRIENGYAEYDYSFSFEPVEYNSIAAFESLRNCIAEPDFEGDNDSAALRIASRLLTDCFDVYDETIKENGLYVFKNGMWERLPQNRIISVNSRPDLPDGAEDGQTAVIEENRYLIGTARQYMYIGQQFKRIHLNPEPPEWMWLSDCHIKAVIGYYNSETGMFEPSAEERGFELTSDKDKGYIFFWMNSGPWDSYKQYYIYTRESGIVSLPSGTFGIDGITAITVAKGWNRIYENSSVYTAEKIEHYDNLPYAELPSYTYQDYYYQITEYDCELSSQSFIGTDKFYSIDNARGLWYFSLGRWRKAGDTDA